MAEKCLFGRPYCLYPNFCAPFIFGHDLCLVLDGGEMYVKLGGKWGPHKCGHCFGGLHNGFLPTETNRSQSVVSTDARHNACSHTSIAWKCHQHFAFWPQVNASLEKITWFSLPRNFTDTLALQTQKRTPKAQHGSENLSGRSRLKNNTLVFSQPFLITVKLWCDDYENDDTNACYGSELSFFR